jgi:DNA-binding CsgD family transcriptional regulator
MVLDRTNRETAADRFLSVKTVEGDMRDMVQRLGVCLRVVAAREPERGERARRA